VQLSIHCGPHARRSLIKSLQKKLQLNQMLQCGSHKILFKTNLSLQQYGPPSVVLI